MKEYLYPAKILLPDFPVLDKAAWQKWATIACDQFTSEPEYWESVKETVGDAPSTLSLILPEVYLDRRDELSPRIHGEMERVLSSVLTNENGEGMIYLSRTQSDGEKREGIVARIDLEDYSYEKGSQSIVRATEGTVLERIPPRVAVRRGAPLELPHVMLLIDDPDMTVIEPVGNSSDEYKTAYDFDLMLGGGHVTGRWIPKSLYPQIRSALAALITKEALAARYGSDEIAPLLFAVGDGNHSLASAKAYYEEIKAKIGKDAAASHPARYALVEIVNLHSPALRFEPIYRVVFGADRDDLLSALSVYASSSSRPKNGKTQRIVWLSDGETGEITVEDPSSQLPVGSLQSFLDGYMKEHPAVTIDYIHGEDALASLSKNGAVGFLFSGMEKSELFATVIYDGSLPRKTFSMGHARDKRYYLEARKIR